MSLLKVAAGKKYVEIDVCGNCRTIWYDKGEFETLTPQDGLLDATISAGKAYRREIVIAVTADLRGGRRRVGDMAGLKVLLKSVYHVPTPDIAPIIGALQSQRVIWHNSKTDRIGLVQTEKAAGVKKG